jgi:hypothetical protein
MIIKIRDRLRKIIPYVDEPNSFNENVGETLGIIVLILFVGSFLYLVIGGAPTILIVIKLFIQATTGLFNIHP